MGNSELSVTAPYRFRVLNKRAGFFLDEPFNYADGALQTVSNGFWDVFSGTLSVIGGRLSNATGSPNVARVAVRPPYTIPRTQNMYMSAVMRLPNIGVGGNAVTVAMSEPPPGPDFSIGFRVLNNGATYVINKVLPSGETFVTTVPADGMGHIITVEAIIVGSDYNYFLKFDGGLIYTGLAAFTVDASEMDYLPYIEASLNAAFPLGGIDQIQWSSPNPEAL